MKQYELLCYVAGLMAAVSHIVWKYTQRCLFPAVKKYHFIAH